MKKIPFTIALFALTLAVSAAFDGVAHAASPDLSVTLTDQTGYVKVGENIVYTVSIKNIGNANATNVTMKTTIPDVLTYVSDTSGNEPKATEKGYDWTFGQINAGTSRSFEISFSTDKLLQTFTQDQVGFVKAAAVVSSTTPDYNKKNDSATAETLLIPPVPDQTRVI